MEGGNDIRNSIKEEEVCCKGSKGYTGLIMIQDVGLFDYDVGLFGVRTFRCMNFQVYELLGA